MITGRLHYIAVLVMVIEEIPTIDAQNLISLDWIKMQENWMSPNISLIRVQKLRRNPKTKGLHYTSHPKMVIGLIDIEYKKMYKPINKTGLNWNPGHLDVTEYLLKQKANIKARDKKERTPLHLASRWGNYKYSHFIEKIKKNNDIDLKCRTLGRHQIFC